jgi:hypothetical protein
MAKENKTQTWLTLQSEVNELLDNSKVPATFKSALMQLLEANLAPKQGGGVAINPPKEIDGVMHYYCRYHQQYEAEGNMVMSQGKSKGYCKASISVWNKANSDIKKFDSDAVKAMASGDFDKAQEIALKCKDLRDSFNNPSFYDYNRDWASFNA